MMFYQFIIRYFSFLKQAYWIMIQSNKHIFSPLYSNEFSHTYKTIRMDLSIIHLKGSHFQIMMASVTEVFFTLISSVDPAEMPPYAIFHLGLHYLSNYPLRGFQNTKG